MGAYQIQGRVTLALEGFTPQLLIIPDCLKPGSNRGPSRSSSRATVWEVLGAFPIAEVANSRGDL